MMFSQNGQVATERALTSTISARVAALTYKELPEEVRALGRQCVLDWIGVTLAGSQAPLVRILVDQMQEQGGFPHAAVVGYPLRLPILSASLVNGAASHALDYDDVNLSMTGHPTVAVLPGLLALAEQRQASGDDLITAFVAGYESACRIGAAFGTSHYARGFHSTGTLGSFGSATACAHLLKLDAERTAMAMGIAGTQAAGLKSMFGTMCKPLHAGRAAYNGLFGALAAKRGFDSRADVLEAPQGFIATQADEAASQEELPCPRGGYYLLENLFKYHAACYLTHAAIECAKKLRREVADTSRISQIVVAVDAGCDKVCNIQTPRTGLEAKFSLRQTVAFAFAGVDTGSLDTYGEPALSDSGVLALREKVRVKLLPSQPHTQAELHVTLEDGRTLNARHDAGTPASDIQEQGRRIDEKFLSLATPVIGRSRSEEVLRVVHRLETLPSVSGLTTLLAPTFR